jgi:hypothetical protein
MFLKQKSNPMFWIGFSQDVDMGLGEANSRLQ